MGDFIVLIISLGIFSLAIYSVVTLFNMKNFIKYRDYRIALIGAFSSMYLSWIVIYMANIHPFIEPVFLNNKS